jgi:hypothetical protein
VVKQDHTQAKKNKKRSGQLAGGEISCNQIIELEYGLSRKSDFLETQMHTAPLYCWITGKGTSSRSPPATGGKTAISSPSETSIFPASAE